MYKKKNNNFIIVSVSPKCAHEKLTNFIVGMNLKYERKDKEDRNTGEHAQVGQTKTRNARNKASKRKRSRKKNRKLLKEKQEKKKNDTATVTARKRKVNVK